MLFAPAAGSAGDVTEERVLAEAFKGKNWFLKGGNCRGQHYSPLKEMNTRTVSDLGLAWARKLPVPNGISATPIVVDGVIHLSGAHSVVFVCNARAGPIRDTRGLGRYDISIER